MTAHLFFWRAKGWLGRAALVLLAIFLVSIPFYFWLVCS